MITYVAKPEWKFRIAGKKADMISVKAAKAA
jgi:hypothetical protein